MTEIWKPIASLEGNCEISNRGRVRSLKGKGKILTLEHSTSGRASVVVRSGDKLIRLNIEKVVASHFLLPSDEKIITHIDGDVSNNAATNLVWGTPLPEVAADTPPKESWKTITWLNGDYEVSSLGRVKSNKRSGQMLTVYTSASGGDYVNVRVGNKIINYWIDALLEEYFPCSVSPVESPFDSNYKHGDGFYYSAPTYLGNIGRSETSFALATALATSMDEGGNTNCKWVSDCRQCVSCTDCVSCRKCTECVACVKCVNCRNCDTCESCFSCSSSTASRHCSACVSITNCECCSNVINGRGSVECKQSKDITGCSFVNRCYSVANINHAKGIDGVNPRRKRNTC